MKEKKLKIIIASEIFPPDIGGPATYSWKIAEILKQKGWQVKLICYSDKIENDNYPFEVIRILRGKNSLSHYFQYFWHLLKIAKDSDIIYAQGPVSSGLPAVICGFLLGKKVVVKVVGDYAWEQARNLGKTEIGIDEFQKQNLAGKIGWLKKIERWVGQKANKVIVPSQYLKKIICEWGVPEEKIEVIYNAETLKFITTYKSPKGLIISIGRLVSWKGFNTLIQLMPELLKENPNFRLEIYGEGPEEEKLKKLIADLRLEKKVSIDKLNHDQLMLKLTNAEIFVLNSGYEGLSHTVLEAMVAGVPVIITNVGGNPEIIQDGYNGLLVEYNDKEQLKAAILKLDQNSELRQKFVTNSQKVLEKFSFEDMINKTINLLQSI